MRVTLFSSVKFKPYLPNFAGDWLEIVCEQDNTFFDHLITVFTLDSTHLSPIVFAIPQKYAPGNDKFSISAKSDKDCIKVDSVYY